MKTFYTTLLGFILLMSVQAQTTRIEGNKTAYGFEIDRLYWSSDSACSNIYYSEPATSFTSGEGYYFVFRSNSVNSTARSVHLAEYSSSFLTFNSPARKGKKYLKIRYSNFTPWDFQGAFRILYGNSVVAASWIPEETVSWNIHKEAVFPINFDLPADIQCNSQLSFPLTKIGESRIIKLAVRNSGEADLVISKLSFSNPCFRSLLVLPKMIICGDSLLVPVTFQPTTSGTSTGTMTIGSNSANHKDYQVSLTGTGEACEISIIPGDLSFDYRTGQNKSFTVFSNSPWTISQLPPTFNISPTNIGNTGTTTCQITSTADNPFATPRIVLFHFKNNCGGSSSFQVTQAPSPCFLSVDKSSVSLGSGASNKANFTISANSDWEVKSDSPLFKVDMTLGTGTKTVTVTALSDNTESLPKNATISITGCGSSKTITVTQAGVACSMFTNVAGIGLNGSADSKGSFIITSNAAWNFNGIPDWLSVSSLSGGTGTTYVTITALKANPSNDLDREAILNITSGCKNIPFRVIQSGADCEIPIAPSTVVLDAQSGSTGTFRLSSNGPWSIFGGSEWSRPNGQSGAGSVTITVTARSANSSFTERSAVFYVNSCGGIRPLIVIQKPQCDMFVTSPTISLGSATGSAVTVSLISTAGWTVSGNTSGWFSVSLMSGNGSASLTVTTSQANSLTATRTAAFFVTGCNGITKTITVSQAGISQCLVPPAPSMVSASDGIYTDKVRISWPAVAGSTSYNVYRGEQKISSNQTALTFDDLAAGTNTVTYFVKAVNSCGEGNPGFDTGYKRVCSVPSAPVDLSASDGVFCDKVRLSWLAVSGASSYSIYRGSVQIGTTTSITWYEDSSASAVPATYSVAAVNICGEGSRASDTGFRMACESCSPNWKPVTYLNSTLVYGKVTFKGAPAASGDKVGAFAGPECRGVSPVVIQDGIAFFNMVVHGDKSEKIIFKFWRNSECKEYSAAPEMVSNPGGVVGYPPNFIMINIIEVQTLSQTISLKSQIQGWNLISWYIDLENVPIEQIFPGSGCGIVQVKNNSQSFTNDPTVPAILNSLKYFKKGEAYFVKSNADCSVTQSGVLIGNTNPVQLNQGWNLLGFTFNKEQPAKTAFGLLINNGSLNQVKNLSSSFDPSIPDFLNTLSVVKPGEGYHVKMNSLVESFVFPEPAGLKKGVTSEITAFNSNFMPVYYLKSTTGFFTVSSVQGNQITNAVVGAFVGGECRGVGQVITNNGKSYCTIQIHGEKPEKCLFKIWDVTGSKEYLADQNYITDPGNSIGFWPNLLLLSFSALTRADFIPGKDAEMIYPNPFCDKIYITDYQNVKNIVFMNISGQPVYEVNYPTREISAGHLPPGIYLVRCYDFLGQNSIFKIIKSE